MKYIRTKDGRVFKLETYNQVNGYYSCSRSYGCYEDEIDKIDDTIEELCDDFISRERLICKSRLKQTCEMLLKEKAEIYGAIWTDKGLIYVAKMNDKGELELL